MFQIKLVPNIFDYFAYLSLVADPFCFIQYLREAAIYRRGEIETLNRRENECNSQEIDFHEDWGSGVQGIGDVLVVFFY